MSIDARPLRSAILILSVCTTTLFGWTGVVGAQSNHAAARPIPSTPRTRPPQAPTSAPMAAPTSAPLATETKSVCADGETIGPAVSDALAGGDMAFALLARARPDEAFRCSSLFPTPAATAVLLEAALTAPFDAVGAADQLSKRHGGAAIIARALDPDRLARALDTGLPFFETRHELRYRLPASTMHALEERAAKALTLALATDPATVSAQVGALIDEMADDPSKNRFRVAAALPTDTLFMLIARIGGQLYTSSFDGLLDLLEAKLKQEKRSLLDLVGTTATATASWTDFFVAVAANGRVDTLFAAAAGDAGELARRSVRALLSPDRALDPPIIAGTLADAMDVTSDEVRAALEDELADQHRTATSRSVKLAVGLAGGLHAGRLAGRTATAAFLAERFGDVYSLPAAPVMSATRLFPGGVNVQRVTFYDDPDGQSSFKGFLRQKRAMGWTVQTHAGFIVVLSPERNGRRIVTVADIPSAGEQGRIAVREWLSREKLSPTVVIHRGHSYHEDETMPEIGPEAVFVFWGSCGGQLRLRATLEQAPDALVLATRNIGTTQVNQTLLRMIEEQLLADGVIDWNTMWKEAKSQIRDLRFASYQRPDQNATLLALRAWRTWNDN